MLKKDEIRITFGCAYVLAGQECKGCVTTYSLCTGPRNGGAFDPGLVCCSWGSRTTVCRVPVWLRCWGWGTCPGQRVPSNLGFSFFSRTKTLAMSFGLVACVLGLVLILCFADEFLVSGWAALDGAPAGPSRCWGGGGINPGPEPRPLPTSSAPQPGGQC